MNSLHCAYTVEGKRVFRANDLSYVDNTLLIIFWHIVISLLVLVHPVDLVCPCICTKTKQTQCL